jgi:protein-tyrosine-phosphatase
MKILFICKSNQFRSQMAASIFNKITGTTDADSAGTYVGSADEPEGSIIENFFRTPDFFELMEENGINIRSNRTKKLLPEMLEKDTMAISMVEEPFIPDFLLNNKKVIRWEVENPPFATRQISEKTYYQIKGLVEQLISSITTEQFNS